MPALRQAGHEVVQVYSRTMESAQALASRSDALAINDLADVSDADVYIIAVKDSALQQLIPVLCKGREKALFLHTAGSMPMRVFDDFALHYGVLYPMQTFSKERQLDFSRIPIFINGNDEVVLSQVHSLASSVSRMVMPASDEQRRCLHLAAVFACNFSNHCYQLAAKVLEQKNIPFDVMLPLIDETAQKVHELSPADAQTGPAVRFDENVMGMQMALLEGDSISQEVYRLMSRSIHETANMHNDD